MGLATSAVDRTWPAGHCAVRCHCKVSSSSTDAVVVRVICKNVNIFSKHYVSLADVFTLSIPYCLAHCIQFLLQNCYVLFCTLYTAFVASIVVLCYCVLSYLIFFPVNACNWFTLNYFYSYYVFLSALCT